MGTGDSLALQIEFQPHHQHLFSCGRPLPTEAISIYPDHTMTSYGMSGANAPKFKANMTLRAFRSESGLGWEDFNNLWAELCHYINCPANDVLLDRGMAGTSGYDGKLSSITNDILQSGIFGCDRPATWKYGRYEQEPDLPA